jgi:hypothetical protein
MPLSPSSASDVTIYTLNFRGGSLEKGGTSSASTQNLPNPTFPWNKNRDLLPFLLIQTRYTCAGSA